MAWICDNRCTRYTPNKADMWGNMLSNITEPLDHFVCSMWQNFTNKQQIKCKHIQSKPFRIVYFFFALFTWFVECVLLCVVFFLPLLVHFLCVYRLLFGVSVSNSFTSFSFIKINLECIIVYEMFCFIFYFFKFNSSSTERLTRKIRSFTSHGFSIVC